MDDFFQPPPPPPEPEPEPQRFRTPKWVAAPAGTLPGTVALDLLLARTERVAVAVGRIGAYSSGFEFDIVILSAVDDERVDPLLFHHSIGRAHGEMPPERLRIGIEFPDGSRATNVGGPYLGTQRPTAPVMQQRGGGGGGGSWRQAQWVWPLPDPGTMFFVCEWPAMNIPVTRVAIDAQLILDAAARAQPIFTDDHLPDPPADDDDPGWSAYTT